MAILIAKEYDLILCGRTEEKLIKACIKNEEVSVRDIVVRLQIEDNIA